MIDYSLYLVTDRSLSLGRTTVDVVQKAIKGGVRCVQLREKACSSREMIVEGRALAELLNPLKIPFIVNDRVDVAMACNADGVHLGQSDMHIADARRILGGDKIIGISAESVEDAIRAEQEGADYIGISPVFSTVTKSDTAVPLGLDGVKAIRENVDIPLVGIGGISAQNAGDVIRSGADGVAVVSAIVAAPCPEESARQLTEQLQSALKEC